MTSDEIMIYEYKKASIEYRKRVCSKCNDKQKKERNCAILRGFSKTSCRHMTLALNQRKELKKMNKEYISNTMGEICELRDEVNKNQYITE